MAADGSGVVDQDLKYLGYKNLYACDNSVFPVSRCGNPSLTLTALDFALRNNSSNTAQMSLYRGLKIVLQGSGKLEIIKSYHCIRTFLGKASW